MTKAQELLHEVINKKMPSENEELVAAILSGLREATRMQTFQVFARVEGDLVYVRATNIFTADRMGCVQLVLDRRGVESMLACKEEQREVRTT